MKRIQSLEDLQRARQEAAQKREKERAAKGVVIHIAMASCSIAAGAQETLRSLQEALASENLNHVRIIQTGCLGLCAVEPTVQVSLPGQSPVLYGRVSPEIGRQIVERHIQQGTPLAPYILEAV